MRKLRRAAIAATGAIGLAVVASPAFADLGPTTGDVVGVGSDTVQNIGNFLADGRAGTPTHNGYNFAGNKNRLVSFDATPDENDRTGYLNQSTSAALRPLNPTVILRAGTTPVLRPNGSGAGINALLADTTAPYKISYVRMSRAPKLTEQQSACTAGFGVAGSDACLRVVQLANDDLEIGVNSTATNAPSGLSVADLKHIYNCDAGYTTWNGTLGGSSSDAIVPLIPQAGSGTRSTFLSDIGLAAPNTSCVKTVEENDPASLNDASDGFGTLADRIVPFSSGRKALYDSGYFHDPSVAFPGGTALTSGVSLLSGTPALGGTAYDDNRALYVVFRANDASSTTPWQPGGLKNWAQELFIPGTISLPAGTAKPYANTGPGLANIADGGVTAAYADKGNGFHVG